MAEEGHVFWYVVDMDKLVAKNRLSKLHASQLQQAHQMKIKKQSE